MSEPAKDEYELLEQVVLTTFAPIRAVGWVVVPVEPTKEMMQAGYNEAGGRAIDTWAAMIAAAPGVKS